MRLEELAEYFSDFELVFLSKGRRKVVALENEVAGCYILLINAELKLLLLEGEED